MNLQNKNIVITGASSGIGERVAMKVAEKGARPVLIARSYEKLLDLKDEIEKSTGKVALCYPLDVSDREQVERVFTKIQKELEIDILLNNAGFGVFDLFEEASFKDIEQMFSVNVLGLMACTKAVLPSMRKRNAGHIINVASQAAKFATPKSSVYAATKHAVLGFTNSLRMELKGTNIHVSAVNPGPIETNFFTIADKSGNYVKNVKNYMLQADKVADKIVALMIHPKRELNLPKWMNFGSVLHQVFPSMTEKVIGRFVDKK